jgi:DnaJ like chaperone protein
MGWKGKFFGALLGFLLTRSVWGAVVGAMIGAMFDQNPGFVGGGPADDGVPPASISDVFFRATFEVMGHVAKADGRVSEAEIGAARNLMQELRLGPREVDAAIECFRFGKSAGYDADAGVDRLRQACATRQDLLRAFIELQLRAALAGNGISPPARAILTRIAARLGMSGMEFVHIEAGVRARRQWSGAGDGRPAEKPLSQSYAELEIPSGTSDQEVTKAYRRQMSRHHPDKLVANGLPESMAQVAKEKTQRIQEAYEAIRAARGMR